MNLPNDMIKKIIQTNSDNKENINENDSKKYKKYKKISQKYSSKNNKKIIPLLKSPSKVRKHKKNNISAPAIVWDNKNIEEHHLNRKLHPRNKINEVKTSYPDGDNQDFYEKGINKVNGLKIEQFKKNDLKIMDNNEDINDKFDDISKEEMKMSLQNTLINKFHKELKLKE